MGKAESSGNSLLHRAQNSFRDLTGASVYVFVIFVFSALQLSSEYGYQVITNNSDGTINSLKFNNGDRVDFIYDQGQIVTIKRSILMENTLAKHTYDNQSNWVSVSVRVRKSNV